MAALGEAVVVVGGPEADMGVVSPLEEAGVRVFLQIIRVTHKQVIKLRLLHLPSRPKLTVIGHVHLRRREDRRTGARERERDTRGTVMDEEGKQWRVRKKYGKKREEERESERERKRERETERERERR